MAGCNTYCHLTHTPPDAKSMQSTHAHIHTHHTHPYLHAHTPHSRAHTPMHTPTHPPTPHSPTSQAHPHHMHTPTYLLPAVTSTAVKTLGSQLKISMSGPCMPVSCLSAATFMADSMPLMTLRPVVDLRSRSLLPKSLRRLCSVWSRADSRLQISLPHKQTNKES